MTDVIRARLIGLTLVDQAGASTDTLTVTLDDRGDGREAALDLPPPALARLRLGLGYLPGGIVDMGVWTVNRTEFGGPPLTLTLHARAADLDAGWKAPRTQSYHDVTLGGVLAAVAARRGVMLRVAPDLASVAIAHIDQTAESDVAFVRALARAQGATAKVANGRLIVVRRGGGEAASGVSVSPVVLMPGQVSRWRATRDATPSFGRVEAVWSDLRGGEPVVVSVGDGDPARRLSVVHGSEAEALTAVRSAHAAGVRAAGSVHLSLPGDPRLLAETPVTLSGFRPGVDGSWVVSMARHRLDGQGYATEVDLAPRQ